MCLHFKLFVSSEKKSLEDTLARINHLVFIVPHLFFSPFNDAPHFEASLWKNSLFSQDFFQIHLPLETITHRLQSCILTTWFLFLAYIKSSIFWKFK